MLVTMRRAIAVMSCALLFGGLGVTACSDDNGTSGGGKTPSTTRSEDAPDTGPQSGPNPAGGEPVPGSAPPG
jgi:hypothetical protein